jgi:hypothetical protein
MRASQIFGAVRQIERKRRELDKALAEPSPLRRTDGRFFEFRIVEAESLAYVV